MLLLLVLLGFLFFAALAMCVNEGLWSNTILLICILISGTAASAAGVPLGAMAFEKAGQDDSFAWYYVFAGMWGVFALTLLILRIAVDKASTIRVRYLPVVEKLGGILMGLVVAVMLTSFAAFTLLYGPIKAGEWKMSDASESQVSAFKRITGPFYSVSKSFAKAEKIDFSYYGK